MELPPITYMQYCISHSYLKMAMDENKLRGKHLPTWPVAALVAVSQACSTCVQIRYTVLFLTKNLDELTIDETGVGIALHKHRQEIVRTKMLALDVLVLTTGC